MALVKVIKRIQNLLALLGWYRGTSTPYGTMYGGYPVVPTSPSLFSIIHRHYFLISS